MTDEPGPGHNQRKVLVELTPELAEFLITNCESNMVMGLNMLRGLSEDNARKMVDMIEKFKAIKAATEKANA